MSVDTLARVREEYPDFSDALKRGKLKAVAPHDSRATAKIARK
jgi:hypothetical protein